MYLQTTTTYGSLIPGSEYIRSLVRQGTISKDAAIKDGKDFIDSAKEDLERCIKLLVTKEITQDDFGFLLRGKESLAKMEALKQAGLALVKIDKFRKSLIETITTTAFDFFLK